MERLTIPDEKIEGGVRRTVIDSREVKKNAMTIYWALKKYEDTGLTPTEIIQKHMNDKAEDGGWIPVEIYGLPSSYEDEFKYWVTVQYHNGFRRTELAKWDYCDRCFKYLNGRKILQDVIAYKSHSYPEPYCQEN